jgi:thiamine biosynthesis lipoprotein
MARRGSQVLLIALLATGAWNLNLRLTAATFPVTGWQGRTMGSPYTVQVVGRELADSELQSLQAAVESCLLEVNRQMSHYQSQSELSRFNRHTAPTPFKVSAEFARVMRFSLDLNRESQGAFDPTLGPLINLWGFGEKGASATPPSDAEILAAKRLTGCRYFSVTPQDELIKTLPELTVNLSAVAKGFGVDEMVRVLTAHGFTNLYASIAGEVRVLGHNPEGLPWRIGISAPVDHWREGDPFTRVVSLSNRALSTSGDYQKYYTNTQGQRLSHLLDPQTGKPVAHTVASVTVVGPDAMTTDALSTTLFVLGVEDGLRFVERRTNTAALFVLRSAEGGFRPVTSSRFEPFTRPVP